MIEHAESINALAKAVGRNRSTVTKWLQKPNFPVQREAPWSPDDIAEVRAWASSLQADRSQQGRIGRVGVEPVPDEQTKDYWLMRKYRAQALEAEERLVDAEAATQKAVGIFTEVRARMLMVPSSLRTLCAGATPDEIERAADEQIRRALDDIADRLGDAPDAEADAGGDREGDPNAPAAQSL